MMYKIDIKPLSVNEAWQGRRFKTETYKRYEFNLLLMLPKIDLPNPPYQLEMEFGFSNILSDIDNPVKCLMDILQKKYSFNDKDVFQMLLRKRKVSKGKDYLKFKISTYELL